MTGWSPQRKALFYTELEKLAEAGFGVREAARVMIDSGVSAAERAVLERVLAGIEAGKTIGGSFGEAGVSKLEQVLVEAGEKSGKPGPAYAHLAGYFELLAESRKQVRRAMVYPLVLLHLGLFLASMPPALQEIDFGELLVRFVISVVVLWLVIIGGAVAVKALLARAPESLGIDRLLNALPLVGKARRSLALARFARVFHAALLAGLGMRETVRMAGEASLSAEVAAATERMAEAVKDGVEIGPVMTVQRVFPKAFSSSYSTAEQSGSLDQEMDRWAKRFASESNDRIRALAVALPKIGYVLIVGFVVWKIFSFYSGYYGAIEKVLEE